jgi:hypothetical protein
MDDILKVALPAGIALLGTITTVAIGYRQWKRQQDIARNNAFLADKQSAYKNFWNKIEEAHIKIRTRKFNPREFDNCLREVNSFYLKHSLYLEEQDRDLSNRYLEAIFGQKILIERSKDENAKRQIGKTARLDISPYEGAEGIRMLDDEINQIRNEIIERIKKVVGGNLS